MKHIRADEKQKFSDLPETVETKKEEVRQESLIPDDDFPHQELFALLAVTGLLLSLWLLIALIFTGVLQGFFSFAANLAV